MEKLTVEDRIMGRTEPRPKTELESKAFTSEMKYKVAAIGNDNYSIVDGDFLNSILDLEQKQKITSGEMVIETNGLRIERIVEPVSEKISATDEEVVKENLTTPKPRRKRAK